MNMWSCTTNGCRYVELLGVDATKRVLHVGPRLVGTSITCTSHPQLQHSSVIRRQQREQRPIHKTHTKGLLYKKAVLHCLGSQRQTVIGSSVECNTTLCKHPNLRVQLTSKAIHATPTPPFRLPHNLHPRHPHASLQPHQHPSLQEATAPKPLSPQENLTCAGSSHVRTHNLHTPISPAPTHTVVCRTPPCRRRLPLSP